MKLILLQDTFLPHIEDGTITFVGATTENPSFQVNDALLSRCKVVVLEKHSLGAIKVILQRSLEVLYVEEVPKGTREPTERYDSTVKHP